MSIVLEGRLLQILPQQNGTGKNGPWIKQDFIIETHGEYSRKICISAWGEKAGEIKGFDEGDQLKVSVNIESREFNERWYTDIKAWRIEKESPPRKTGPAAESEVPPPEDVPPPADDDLLPF